MSRERSTKLLAKHASNSNPTLRKALQDYLNVRQLKPATAKDYAMRVNNYLNDWLDQPITSITSEMVENRYRDLGIDNKRGNGRATASVTMRVLRALFNFSKHKYRDSQGNPVITVNPVGILSDLKIWSRYKRRQSVIRDHQLKPWFDAVMSLKYSSVRDYLVFLILTGTRRSEAVRLIWQDVDLDFGLVTFHDTKNGDDFSLPLSDYLHQMLKKRRQFAPKNNPYVFPGKLPGKPLSPCLKTNERISKTSGVPFTFHDLRRTFISTADKLDITHYALKRLVNHRIGNDVTDGYIVHDVERLRKPMQMITDHILAEAQQGHFGNQKPRQTESLTLPELETLITAMKEFKDYLGYFRLLSELPLKPIRSERQYQTARQMYKRASDTSLTDDERDYFQALLILITAYEHEQRAQLMELTPRDVLKRLMKAKGLTQHDLVKILVYKSTVSEFLSGKHMLRKKNVFRLADGLGVEPELFMRRNT